MVAGQLTNVAWVDSGTYLDCLTDTRSQCTAFAPPGGGENPASDAQRVLQISGSYQHQVGRKPSRIELSPVNQIDLASPTADDAQGDVLLQSFAAGGELLSSVRWKSATTRESCAQCVNGRPHLHANSAVSILIPAAVANQEPARIELRDLKSGNLLATRTRTASAPHIASLGSRMIDGVGVASHSGTGPFVELFWDATDADGDALSADILLSCDGGQSWSAIGVNQRGASMKFALSDIPVAKNEQGIVKVRVTDGLNVVDAEMPTSIGNFGLDASGSKVLDEGSIAGDSQWSNSWLVNVPDIHLISPNASQSYPFGASILLHASGWDLEDQFLPDTAFTWTSSIAGAIGTGRQILVSTLNPGTHLITLRGTDSGGSFVEKSVSIIVTARVIFGADINGDSIVNGIDLSAMLANWGGSGLGDLNFDGLVGGPDLAVLLAGWTG